MKYRETAIVFLNVIELHFKMASRSLIEKITFLEKFPSLTFIFWKYFKNMVIIFDI